MIARSHPPGRRGRREVRLHRWLPLILLSTLHALASCLLRHRWATSALIVWGLIVWQPVCWAQPEPTPAPEEDDPDRKTGIKYGRYPNEQRVDDTP